MRRAISPAWFEAWIGGRWHMFDPRNNVPRSGRILMARGRDASDVAIATTFGPNILESFRVWTDEIAGRSTFRTRRLMSFLTVRHSTVYRYREPVSLGEHRMMFRPRESHDLRLIQTGLTIIPRPAHLRWLHDPFDNSVAVAELRRHHMRTEFRKRGDAGTLRVHSARISA